MTLRRHNGDYHRRRGMTLLETLLALAVALTLFVALSQMTGQIVWGERSRSTSAMAEELRCALELIRDTVAERQRGHITEHMLNALCGPDERSFWNGEPADGTRAIAGTDAHLCIVTQNSRAAFGSTLTCYVSGPDGQWHTHTREASGSPFGPSMKKMPQAPAKRSTLLLQGSTVRLAYSDGNAWFTRWPVIGSGPLRAIRVMINEVPQEQKAARGQMTPAKRSALIVL
jgi:type II secretory pathway pseudopilin PulG